MTQLQTDTVALIERSLAPDFRLTSLPTADSPVFLAVAWPSAEGVTGLKPRLPAGRGLTPQQALLGAAAEALELRSSLAQNHTNDLARFDRQEGVATVAAQDLRSGAVVPVLAQEVYLDAAAVLDEPLYCDASSTGCATGTTRAEAMAAAVHECIERDALALWWHGGREAGALGVDLIDLRQPRLCWWLHRRRRMTRLLDLTTDIGVPVVAAVSAEPDGRFVSVGSAARPAIADAALAAVTEMVQAEVGMAEARAAGDPDLATWDTAASVFVQSQFQPVTRPISATAPGDFAALLQHLAGLGHQTLAVDLTLPADPLPSVRVLVPGLCAMRGRIDTDRFRRVCPGRDLPCFPEPF